MSFKNLDIRKKIFLFIGLAFVLTMLVFGGVVLMQFNGLQNATNLSLKNSLMTKEKQRIKNSTHVMAQNLEILVQNQAANTSKEELKELII